MSRKNSLIYHIATGQSLAASFNSAPTIVRNLDNCAYQINVVTANAVGTIKVQASLDYAVNADTGAVTNVGTWTDLTLDGTPALAGANDSILLNLNQLPFNAIRLAYVRTSGTGTCDIYVMARQIGG